LGAVEKLRMTVDIVAPDKEAIRDKNFIDQPQ
jgi:hypothetical protein